jgi:hypothetical protein
MRQLSLAVALFASVAAAGMSGTYTIKPDGSGDFRTIYEAGFALGDSGLSGDCVFEVYGDTVPADVLLDGVPGSDSCRTTFRPGPGARPVLASGVFRAAGTHNLKLDGLEFFDAGLAFVGCNGLRVGGCRVRQTESGILLEDFTADTIAGNVVVGSDEGGAGALRAEVGLGLVVANNFFCGPGAGQEGEGLVSLDVVDARVCFNTLRFSPLELAASTALFLEQFDGRPVDARNNLFVLAPPADTSNACVGAADSLPGRLLADYNCYHAESWGRVGLAFFGSAPTFFDWAAWQALGFEANGLNADPLLVGPGDPHLRSGSPCIGAGVPVPGITTDIDGEPRDPDHPCIGADEYGGGAVAEGSHTLDAPRITPEATIVRGILILTPDISNLTSDVALHDFSGRKVMDLKPGDNDVSRLSPGVYFVRTRGQGARGEGPGEKVVITR